MTPPASGLPRLLDLYCGIGGCSTALTGHARSIGAVDINTVAAEVYRHNHATPMHVRLLDSTPSIWLRSRRADLWWASPPCQPFTRRGHGRDLDDPRAETFLALLRHLDAVRPDYLALENVAGFEGSRAHGELLATLEQAGYHQYHQRLLCPTELGMPNRRPRFYLVASRLELDALPTVRADWQPLASFLDPQSDDDPRLRISDEQLHHYGEAMHFVDPQEDRATGHCFTSAYGRSPVRSGSYLRLPDGAARRFSPREILSLLGFPASFRLPDALPKKNAWRLVGNSLSLPAVRFMLSSIPALRGLGDPTDLGSFDSVPAQR